MRSIPVILALAVLAAPMALAETVTKRPGDLVGGSVVCTLGFLFADDAGNEYFATAAHCVNGVGQNLGWGQVSHYFKDDEECSLLPTGCDYDFALIKVDPAEARAEPGIRWMLSYPTGVADAGAIETGAKVAWTGNGIPAGPTQKRDGLFVDDDNGEDSYCALGAVVTGDSGGPVVVGAGLALGIVAQRHSPNLKPECAEAFSGNTVEWALRKLAGIGLRLVTVP